MTARQKIPSARALARRSTAPTTAKVSIKNHRDKVQGARVETLRATSVDDTTGSLAEAKSATRPLTEKQKLFVKYWSEGDSILGASHRAGYADGGTLAYRLVKDPAILAVYNERKKAYEAAIGMTRQRVMDGLLEATEMARFLADPMAMIAGWREIGKMCGYYEPVRQKIDINIVNGNNPLARMNRMSDAELLKFIEDEKITIDVDAKEVPHLQIASEIDEEEMEAS